MRGLRVRPLAEADVQAAFDWYEGQGRHYRRALVRRFPYLIYYSVTDADIEVVACTHGRQHPRRWRHRT